MTCEAWTASAPSTAVRPAAVAAESAPPETITTAEEEESISPLAAIASASSASARCLAFTPGWYARDRRIPACEAAIRYSSSGSRARTTNSSAGFGNPLSSTRPIGSNSR